MSHWFNKTRASVCLSWCVSEACVKIPAATFSFLSSFIGFTIKVLFSSVWICSLSGGLPAPIPSLLHRSNQPLTHSRELITSPLIYVGVTSLPPIKAISEQLIDHGRRQTGVLSWHWLVPVCQRRATLSRAALCQWRDGMMKPRRTLLPPLGGGSSRSWQLVDEFEIKLTLTEENLHHFFIFLFDFHEALERLVCPDL